MNELSIKVTTRVFWYDVEGTAYVGDNRFHLEYQANKHYIGPFFACGPSRMEKRVAKQKAKIKAHFAAFKRSIELA